MTAPVIIGNAALYLGDCLEVLRTLGADSVDAIVTDPPYGLGFMGKAWDHAVPGVPFWLEMLRVAKPGAYLVAFGGTRTFHRMACAIEDAGWELRDTLMWVYGSGFPKSHNGEWGGTALKPAWEPIILARKPLIGTVEANWREHGTGALNIDGCRIEGSVPVFAKRQEPSAQAFGDGLNGSNRTGEQSSIGRWPANLIHDGSEEVLALFPETHARGNATPKTQARNQDTAVPYAHPVRIEKGDAGDAGSAARFFYCAKADRADRNDGCAGMPETPKGQQWGETFAAGRNPITGERTQPIARNAQNHHPTVKPTDLMRWLCRLVTPPGGLILDPFTGSGSTGRGAILEGFRFAGIELDPDYVRIAEARIASAVEQRRIDTAQGSLFGEAA